MSRYEDTPAPARIASMGRAWLASQPDGDLRDYVLCMLHYDYRATFQLPPGLLTKPPVEIPHAIAAEALIACGYSQQRAYARTAPKVQQAKHATSTREGMRYNEVDRRTGIPASEYEKARREFGVWAFPAIVHLQCAGRE